MSKDSENLEREELPQTGLLRIKQVLKFVPVSKSNWWQGVREGRFPQPVKLSERVTCWRSADVRAVINGTFTPIAQNNSEEVRACPAKRR